ncbi:tRNA (adenosine(37)-N6)-threonylcarbamoyltransferase complex dimerization subunit type 1 TsaB [Chloroflexota bacterium]
MLLAIDTSTDTASIALVRDDDVLAELTWHCEQNHTVELLPNLDDLLNITGLDIQSVTSIAVARGPGSFNGLRVGISTAKGLAFSMNIPIVGVTTMEIEAYQHAATGLPICPVFNAGRGEIASAMFQKKGNRWQQLTTEHITTIDDLCSQITTKTVFCGQYIPVIASQLKKHLKQKAFIPTLAARLRRAGYLAELGKKRLEAGSYDNPTTLQPLYLRQPPITQPKRRLVNQHGGNQQ